MTTPTIDDLRRMDAFELHRLADDNPAAAEQLRLRKQAETTAVAVLAGMGYRFTGTGGWWIGAYADPERRLCYVNIAKGIGVRTDVVLDTDVVEAATIPDQGEGPQPSGAAAWAAPDPGEAHSASAPEGWTQLVVDLRDHPAGVAQTEPIPPRAFVVAWGLNTCYFGGKRGEPGWTVLDPGHDRSQAKRPVDWPETPTSPAMRRVAVDALVEITRNLAEHVPAVAAVLSDVRTATHIMYDADRPPPCSPAAAASSAAQVGRTLLADAGISRLADLAYQEEHAIGTQHVDLIRGLVVHILAERLTPVAEQLAIYLGPLLRGDRTPSAAYRALEEQVRALAKPLGEQLLRGAAPLARQAADDAITAYTAEGYIRVHLWHWPAELG